MKWCDHETGLARDSVASTTRNPRTGEERRYAPAATASPTAATVTPITKLVGVVTVWPSMRSVAPSETLVPDPRQHAGPLRVPDVVRPVRPRRWRR